MTIIVNGVGKGYPKFRNRWHAVGTWLGLYERELHWVLRDIGFTIKPGESVGIIGVNGAGKSTLLKLITGTAVPTEGQISIEGRISALLELGMGFHPEFTGRQNVSLSGRMQGLTQEEIFRLTPSIEGFAEIGMYFDMPVRTYSSGMFVRLAFSVATAVRPEILIVDEALSVGDAYFQHKSFARIRQFREAGTSLLFVSHDPGAIKSLCDRALLLSEGGLLMDGRPDAVLDCYNALIARKEEGAIQAVDEPYAGRSGNGRASIRQVRLSSGGRAAQIVQVGAALLIEIEIQTQEVIPDLALGFMIKDRTGYEIFGTNTWLRHELANIGDSPGLVRKVCVRIARLAIGPGSYSLTLALHSGVNHLDGNFDWWDQALLFQVVGDQSIAHFAGVAALDATFESN